VLADPALALARAQRAVRGASELRLVGFSRVDALSPLMTEPDYVDS
jgi:hypothetical protein